MGGGGGKGRHFQLEGNATESPGLLRARPTTILGTVALLAPASRLCPCLSSPGASSHLETAGEAALALADALSPFSCA